MSNYCCFKFEGLLAFKMKTSFMKWTPDVNPTENHSFFNLMAVNLQTRNYFKMKGEGGTEGYFSLNHAKIHPQIELISL